MMKKKYSLFKIYLFPLFICTLLLSCSKNEGSEIKNGTQNKDEAFEAIFSSFTIINNSDEALLTEAKLEVTGATNYEMPEHGIELYRNGQLLHKFEQGILTTDNFNTVVRSFIIKGETYSIRPYANVNDLLIYGEELSFTSKVVIDVKITSVYPTSGFIYDTLTIEGKNFCLSSPYENNYVALEGHFQNIVFESDSLIKAVVSPSISVSESKISLKTCGSLYDTESKFMVNAPVLDSLMPKEVYVGESFFVYGQNFHSQISTVWLNDIEVPLNKERLDIDQLELIIPENLPSGILDVKIQVLDKIIELEKSYQSTTPILENLDKLSTGFLDTITANGKYFLQPNTELDVLIGGKSQKIIEKTDEKIVVVIDTYFEVENPKIEIKTGSFLLKEDLTMLPPEIISIDKDLYHLENDYVTLKTKYFLGSRYNIKVAGEQINSNDPYEGVNELGELTLTLNDWLDIKVYPDFIFDKDGELKIELQTSYGQDNVNISVYPPKIEELNKTDYYHTGQFEFDVKGLDFGYRNIAKLYIDNEPMVFTDNDIYYDFNNTAASLRLPKEILPGPHTFQIRTGGQFSNEVPFNLVAVVPDVITENTGTRNDAFEISGMNLDMGNMAIYADGAPCSYAFRTPTNAGFIIPHYQLISPNTKITAIYGSQEFDLGTINGIEPYEKVEDYEHLHYNTDFGHFEYNNELYFINFNGISKFNLNSKIWSEYETNMDNIGSSQRLRQVSVSGDKIYIPDGSIFKSYDMQTGQWENVAVAVEDGFSISHGLVVNDEAFVIVKKSGTTSNFYKYDLISKTKIAINQPSHYTNSIMATSQMLHFDNKIYLDVINKDIHVYDMATNDWENIGFPTNDKYRYYTNLYVYNSILYYSGGIENEGRMHRMHSYDLNTRSWTEKTYLPTELTFHIVFGSGNELNILLGDGIYGYKNVEMFAYKINVDPH